jgi:hypothetical protein
MRPLTLILVILAGACLIAGCAPIRRWTTPPDAATLAARDARRAQQQQRDAEARAARLQAEEQRRADDHRRQAEAEQRGQLEGLRNRFKRYTTGELKIMHTRYANLAGLNTTKDLGLAPAATAIWGTADRRHTDMLIDLERELLRRWKTGDAEAYLPHFE